MVAQLDLTDRRILFELDCNSRQSLSEIARHVKLGRDLVAYRIERMQASGLLKRCTVLTNPYKLGLTVYKTYLRLETNKARVAELISYLDAHPRTYWLAECYGEWDLIFSHLARTPKEFYDFQDRLFSDFKDLIVGFNVFTLVNYWWFPKKHLLSSRDSGSKSGGSGDSRSNSTSEATSKRSLCGWSFHTPEFTFGTTPDEYVLDALEYKLIDLLGANSRLGVAELAEKLNSTPSVVKYRLDKLTEMGILAGFRVDVDRDLLGMTLFKVQVHLRDYDVKKELEFREFCRKHPHVSCYVQQIGDCKVEFEVEAKDHNQFNLIMDEVREKFSKHIRFMKYLTIRKDYHHRIRCLSFAPEFTKNTTNVAKIAVNSMSA